MRCTKEIRKSISAAIEEAAQPNRLKLVEEMRTEEKSFNLIKETYLDTLKKEIRPIFSHWFKKFLKENPEYFFSHAKTAGEFTDNLMEEIFKTTYYCTYMFEIRSNRIEEYNQRLKSYSDKVADLENSVIIEVSFVKSMDELKQLVDSIKERVKQIAY